MKPYHQQHQQQAQQQSQQQPQHQPHPSQPHQHQHYNQHRHHNNQPHHVTPHQAPPHHSQIPQQQQQQTPSLVPPPTAATHPGSHHIQPSFEAVGSTQLAQQQQQQPPQPPPPQSQQPLNHQTPHTSQPQQQAHLQHQHHSQPQHHPTQHPHFHHHHHHTNHQAPLPPTHQPQQQQQPLPSQPPLPPPTAQPQAQPTPQTLHHASHHHSHHAHQQHPHPHQHPHQNQHQHPHPQHHPQHPQHTQHTQHPQHPQLAQHPQLPQHQQNHHPPPHTQTHFAPPMQYQHLPQYHHPQALAAHALPGAQTTIPALTQQFEGLQLQASQPASHQHLPHPHPAFPQYPAYSIGFPHQAQFHVMAHNGAEMFTPFQPHPAQMSLMAGAGNIHAPSTIQAHVTTTPATSVPPTVNRPPATSSQNYTRRPRVGIPIIDPKTRKNVFDGSSGQSSTTTASTSSTSSQKPTSSDKSPESGSKPVTQKREEQPPEPAKHVETADEKTDSSSTTPPQTQIAPKSNISPRIDANSDPKSPSPPAQQQMVQQPPQQQQQQPPSQLERQQQQKNESKTLVSEQGDIISPKHTVIGTQEPQAIQTEHKRDTTDSRGVATVTDTKAQLNGNLPEVTKQQQDEKQPQEHHQQQSIPKTKSVNSRDVSPSKKSVAQPKLPDLPYTDGQWTPLDHKGRKRYTKDFLLAVASLLKIKLVPESPDKFAPHYMQGTGSYHGANQPHQHYRYHGANERVRRPSQQINETKPARRIIETRSLNQDTELKKSENPWKPALPISGAKQIEDESQQKSENLLKTFRGHLNKLTPEKYDKIMQQILDLDLKSPEEMVKVIDLVFDKAIDEPKFCALYARACKAMAEKEVGEQKFRYELVRKCQASFETKDIYKGLNVIDREEEIENEKDPDKKKKMNDDLYEDMRQRRRRHLGTIRLIGEMYKLDLLLPIIIGTCINYLLGSISNEHCECLCNLISTVGKKFSREPQHVRECLNSTLVTLQSIGKSKDLYKSIDLESRIRFMILDVVDLSKRNWKARQEDDNPKKLQDIQREVEEKEFLNSRRNHNRKFDGPSGGMFNSRERDRTAGFN